MRTSDSKRRLPNWAVGLILIVVIGVGSFFAYTKKMPWSDPYEVQAVFETAQNLRPKSPVRIAGVDVGEVTKVEPLSTDSPQLTAQAGGEQQASPDEDGARVRRAGDDDAQGGSAAVARGRTVPAAPAPVPRGQPLHRHQAGQPERARRWARTTRSRSIRPRAPSRSTRCSRPFSPTSGPTCRPSSTSSGTRSPNTAEPRASRSSTSPRGGAFKYTSIVNEALQGKRPHDLSGLIRNLDKVVAALGSNEAALQNLVTNFRVVSGSFAAESASLEQAIAKLPDVLDAAEPALRQPECLIPTAAGLRPRGAAGRALDGSGTA